MLGYQILILWACTFTISLKDGSSLELQGLRLPLRSEKEFQLCYASCAMLSLAKTSFVDGPKMQPTFI